MDTALTKFSGGIPARAEDLETGLATLQQTLQSSLGGIPLLRLLKAGYWAYSQENIEVEENSEWAINPYSIQHGFACWGDSILHGEAMVPFTQPPPNKAELPHLGYDWKQQLAMFMQCISGEDDGTTVLYKGTSIGMQNAFKELVTAILNQLRNDKVNIVPVVMLEVGDYNHKSYGQTFYPVLNLKRFIPMDGMSAPVDSTDTETETEPDAEPEPEPEPPAEAKPAPRRRGAKTAPTSAAAPASRRRRRGT
jgi:hypothetical protein